MRSQSVADPTAERRDHRHCDKQKHHIVLTELQIQPAHRAQINEKPGEENIGDISVAKITQRNCCDILAGKNGPPGKRLRKGERLRQFWESSLYVCLFFRIYPGMVDGTVARDEEPH